MGATWRNLTGGKMKSQSRGEEETINDLTFLVHLTI